jgi:hypothetical protein
MGVHPKPKSEKIAVGTYRPDRDKSQTFDIDNNTPQPPDDLGTSGAAFWALAYSQPWISAADQTQVGNVARQIERQEILQGVFADDPKDFRTQRALKELDRSIEAGLFQLLLTPQSRSRVGIELEVKQPQHRSALELMMAARDGEITMDEYQREKASNPNFPRVEPTAT